MKKTAVFWVCVLLTSLAVASEEATFAPPEKQTEHVARQLFAAWSENDLDRIDALFAADGIYEDVPPQMTYTGPEKIKEFMTAIHAWAPDIKFKVTAVRVAESTAVVEWTMTGKQTGPIGGIPASGNDFTVRGASVVEVHRGKITRNSDYYDLSTLVTQFGVRFMVPPPREPAP